MAEVLPEKLASKPVKKVDNDFCDRIKQLIELAGSAEKLAKKSGVGARNISKYASGEVDPSRTRLVNLAKAMEINLLWLASGEGAMRPDMAGHPSSESIHGAGYVHIPKYDIVASAGGGALVHSEQIVDYLAFKTDWIVNNLGVSEKNLALISVTGDSMEPTLSSGDMVLVDVSERKIETNAIYVLQFLGALLVKRIQCRLDGTVVVKSDNTIYEPEVVTGDMMNRLKVIGRVVWYGRRA